MSYRTLHPNLYETEEDLLAFYAELDQLDEDEDGEEE